MNYISIAAREIFRRRLNYCLCLLMAAMAAASVTGSAAIMRRAAASTEHILRRESDQFRQRLDALRDDLRLAVTRLGFTLTILPAGQNLGDWFSDDYGALTMPEAHAAKLAEARLFTIAHFVPRLTRKLIWPERGWTVIVTGTSGEVFRPDLQSAEVRPPQLADGQVILGHEIHTGLRLTNGAQVVLMGRTFQVAACRPESGSKDDITMWFSLRDAQSLLDLPGQINEILALDCRTEKFNPAAIEAEVASILPGAQVVMKAPEALTKRLTLVAEAEQEVALREAERTARLDLLKRQGRAALFLGLGVATASIIGLVLLGLSNVRERRVEIGVFLALGWNLGQVRRLFTGRALLVALPGSAIGAATGYAVAASFGGDMADASGLPAWGIAAIASAALVMLVASWLPAFIAARTDPASILGDSR